MSSQDRESTASDEYMTLTEATRLLGVSRWTLYRRIEEGALETYESPANRRVQLVKRADVESLLPRAVSGVRTGQEEIEAMSSSVLGNQIEQGCPRFVPTGHILVFSVDDLPGEGRYSLYRGVIVCWDDDYDPSVLGVIDAMQPDDREQLIAIYESQGSVSFRWSEAVPLTYPKDGEVIAPGGDTWHILESFVIGRESDPVW